MRSNKQQLVLILVQLCIVIATDKTHASIESPSSRKKCQQADGNPDDNQFCDVASSHHRYSIGTSDSNCLRAAVVDYSRIDGSEDCQTGVGGNLQVYEKIARLAKNNGAQMLVFPEDGILYGTERHIQPCLEEIPDPILETDYNPCLQPNRFNQSFPILTRLSCLAKENGMYVIANYGTKQRRNCDSANGDCDSQDQPKRGVFGQYLMLNTDVVFDPTGNYIRRYRKYHPFTVTEIFAKAPELEHVYFDTDFGRFGVFTCFDMLFKEPAMNLVEKHHIDTAVFPTWWFDELPILPAVQFQDGWSSTSQVNLLASNILKPDRGSIGSSIFSNNRSLYVTPDLDVTGQPRKTKLLVSTLQTKAGRPCSKDPDSKIIEIDDNASSRSYQRKNYPITTRDTIQRLGEGDQDSTVCAGKVCCTVSYELVDSYSDQINRMVIIVRDDLRQGGWYEQVCSVVTLKEPYVRLESSDATDNKPNRELSFDSEAALSFAKLSLKATFETKYVFPSCAHNLTRLVERDQRTMSCNQASDNDGDGRDPYVICQLDYIPANKFDAESNKLYSFGMYGRVYERDLSSL